ncbi:unnamed protein product [marine sediment metagenome]|uniref:Uncharacterized protein n=1 Tax=marine sediment metagenome TaxID=412755 RepID=X1F3F5_9ZZZZ
MDAYVAYNIYISHIAYIGAGTLPELLSVLANTPNTNNNIISDRLNDLIY